jgi:hypothetical protein
VDYSRELFGDQVDLVGGYGHIGDGNIHLNIVILGDKNDVMSGGESVKGRLSVEEVKGKFEPSLM